MSFSTTPGKGTTFEVLFPLVEMMGREENAIRPADSPASDRIG